MSVPTNEELLRRLVESVASGLSLRAAARNVGVGERRARRWKTLPSYQRYLTELRKETFNQVVDRMASATLQAQAKVVRALAKDDLPDELSVKALSTMSSALVALHARLGPAGEGHQGVPGGIVVPGLDARFEAKPEPEGGSDG
jgi:hypothetical protein